MIAIQIYPQVCIATAAIVAAVIATTPTLAAAVIVAAVDATTPTLVAAVVATAARIAEEHQFYN